MFVRFRVERVARGCEMWRVKEPGETSWVPFFSSPFTSSDAVVVEREPLSPANTGRSVTQFLPPFVFLLFRAGLKGKQSSEFSRRKR